MTKMKAAVFVEPGRIVSEDKAVPDIGPLDALIKITTTTICGTDIHILKGEYPGRTRSDYWSRASRRDRETWIGRTRLL